ncbi:hypothetical protein I6A60_33335 [Frankia sp. AgB1.9]|uniref:AAA family ATPase n=1 Tax=unclassified Frankia TaxID=2632575 RepID=UPI001933CDC6|nr:MULTISPECIES: AAA family ATPase [unclassified Frankia]MBL7488122.1 hypothetical protein [Frankia sp. AgW1.1]MBL7552704.1 hypothetical protein [Frankia sp. AgB1.9]MBL7624258.1 hypothetical protein [Frankia sp. AgB1.8]
MAGGAALRYRFGAVEVRSDVALPGYDRYLTGGDDDRDGGGDLLTVVVRGTSVPAPRGALLTRLSTRRGPLEVHAAAGTDRVVTPEGLAAYTLRSDRQVSWHLPSGPPSEAEVDYLVATIIPWALACGPGTPVLHAATLVGPAGAVLLVGRSGAGKSTLSTALHRRLGWPLLGDDAAVLRLAGDEAQVLSCSREVRLWDDAGELLGLGGGIPLPRYGSKSRHSVGGAADCPVPVAAVIRVDSPAEPGPGDDRPTGGATSAALAVMRPVDGLLLLRAGLMRTSLIPVGDAAREFGFLTHWMRGVTFAALDYPHRPPALDEAIRLIADFTRP